MPKSQIANKIIQENEREWQLKKKKNKENKYATVVDQYLQIV